MATASTAPIIPAAYFSAPGRVFGLATDGQVLMGASSGLQATATPTIQSLTTTGAITAGGGLAVTGSSLVSGTVTAGEGLVATTNGLTVTAGGITVTNGGITASGTAAITGDITASGTAAITGAITSSAGITGTSLTATTGGVTVTDGNVALASGDVTLATGCRVAFGGTAIVLTAGTDSGAPLLSTSTTAFGLTFSDTAGNFTLTNSAPPSSANHVVTKGYVDSVATGLDVKASVRVKTTASIDAVAVWTSPSWIADTTEAISVQSARFDGQTLVVGDRVLVDQVGAAAGAGAGIFVVSVADGSAKWRLTRASDADDLVKVTPGMFTFVATGTDAGDRGYVLTSDTLADLATDVLSFSQFTSAAATVPGSNTQLIFNDGGFLGADLGATYNKDTDTLTLAGSLVAASLEAASVVPPGEVVSLQAIPRAGKGAVPGTASTGRLATPTCLLSTNPFAGETSLGSDGTGAVRTIIIPTGYTFFPMGAQAWCTGLVKDTDGTESHSAVITLTAKVSTTEIASVVLDQPYKDAGGAEVGKSRIQWPATKNDGLVGPITVNVTTAVAGATTDTFSLRFGLIGFLVENL